MDPIELKSFCSYFNEIAKILPFLIHKKSHFHTFDLIFSVLNTEILTMPTGFCNTMYCNFSFWGQVMLTHVFK